MRLAQNTTFIASWALLGSRAAIIIALHYSRNMLKHEALS